MSALDPVGRKWRARLLTVAVHLTLLLVWQGAVDAVGIRPFVLPSPLGMVLTLAAPTYAWGANTLVTAAEIFGGFALAVACGVALALAFSWSRALTALLFPLFITLNMVPKVALGRWLLSGLATESSAIF